MATHSQPATGVKVVSRCCRASATVSFGSWRVGLGWVMAVSSSIRAGATGARVKSRS